MFELVRYLKERASLVERSLAAAVPQSEGPSARLDEAMRYSLLDGGKRLRPILALASCEAVGGALDDALAFACALEMIHTYSLIHDDLPAMDDDDLRRGKPTNHKVFGEALAILAGDGLLTKAFEAAAHNAAELKLNGAACAELVRLIAFGAGAEGMVGGQVADLAAEGMTKKLSKAAAARMLEAVHRRKTGALIIASLDAGALLAGASKTKREALCSYGECVGLAFQIADDVLDVVGDKKKLGKKGSDRDNDKLTYASLYGVDGARAKARALVEMAHAHLKSFGARAAVLHELADYIIERDK